MQLFEPLYRVQQSFTGSFCLLSVFQTLLKCNFIILHWKTQATNDFKNLGFN